MLPCFCPVTLRRSQVTSKCDKTKNVAHEVVAECVSNNLYHILTYFTEQTSCNTNEIYLFYIIKKNANDTIYVCILL